MSMSAQESVFEADGAGRLGRRLKTLELRGSDLTVVQRLVS